ncbi:MAG: tetraacyldisaccharide 4'-kinase [Acidobacteria bacterium]|nr:MAG: tetraacyldisaccharide 4'-kinase [Acidobacteriota bacterium]
MGAPAGSARSRRDRRTGDARPPSRSGRADRAGGAGVPRLIGAARWLRPHPALAPLGWLYLAAAQAHHALYDRGWRRPRRVSRPVVSVGNLTVGGSGKTPAVAWLASALARRGFAVGIVSRGYGRRRDGGTLVAGREGRAVASVRDAGDEPVWLARTARAHAVVVARDRRRGAELAIELGCEVILLDDGFQHRRLHRDLDLLLLDARRPFGEGRPLPAGTLREPPAALLRAGLLVLTGAPEPLARRPAFLDHPELPEPLRDLLAAVPRDRRPPVTAAALVPVAVRLPDGGVRDPSWLTGRPVVAVSGIARPERFARTLERLGADLREHLAWPDHHWFTEADAERIAAAADAAGGPLVITTSKDAVRWPEKAPAPAVLEVEMRCGAERSVLELVERAVSRAGAR